MLSVNVNHTTRAALRLTKTAREIMLNSEYAVFHKIGTQLHFGNDFMGRL